MFDNNWCTYSCRLRHCIHFSHNSLGGLVDCYFLAFICLVSILSRNIFFFLEILSLGVTAAVLLLILRYVGFLTLIFLSCDWHSLEGIKCIVILLFRNIMKYHCFNSSANLRFIFDAEETKCGTFIYKFLCGFYLRDVYSGIFSHKLIEYEEIFLKIQCLKFRDHASHVALV